MSNSVKDVMRTQLETIKAIRAKQLQEAPKEHDVQPEKRSLPEPFESYRIHIESYNRLFDIFKGFGQLTFDRTFSQEEKEGFKRKATEKRNFARQVARSILVESYKWNNILRTASQLQECFPVFTNNSSSTFNNINLKLDTYDMTLEVEDETGQVLKAALPEVPDEEVYQLWEEIILASKNAGFPLQDDISFYHDCVTNLGLKCHTRS